MLVYAFPTLVAHFGNPGSRRSFGNMKFVISSCVVLLGSCLLSSGFPTADNVARLARSGSLEVPEGLAYEEVVRHVQRHKQKRLLLNPLTTPIDGMWSQLGLYASRANVLKSERQPCVERARFHGRSSTRALSRSQCSCKPWLHRPFRRCQCKSCAC